MSNCLTARPEKSNFKRVLIREVKANERDREFKINYS